MSVHVQSGSVLVRNSAVASRLPSGLVHSLGDAHETYMSSDPKLTSVTFARDAERDAWIIRLRDHGFTDEELAIFGTSPIAWIESGDGAAWLRGESRGDVAANERPPYQRHEVLSKSPSGLTYVRDRRSGVLRLLTEEEVRDFNDPPPCEECGEQFGCDHYNCARERLLSDEEIEAEVPEQWRAFAREAGLSRGDLVRMKDIAVHNGEYELAPNANSDMRLLELVLLLNDAR